MKPNIHPKYFQTQVTCACGNQFTISSIREKMSVEICYKCHPFYTGEMKFVDTLGRVERYQEKQKIADSKRAQVVAKKKKKEEEKIRQDHAPKSLKEMLMGLQ